MGLQKYRIYGCLCSLQMSKRLQQAVGNQKNNFIKENESFSKINSSSINWETESLSNLRNIFKFASDTLPLSQLQGRWSWEAII